MTTQLDKALAFASALHAGTTDKVGRPYIDHVRRVVRCAPEYAKVVAAVHDIVEDTAHTLPAVSRLIGLSADEQFALALLTRPAGFPYAGYIEGIRGAGGEGGRIARAVKRCDLRDNLGQLDTERDPGELRPRYEAALEQLGEEIDGTTADN